MAHLIKAALIPLVLAAFSGCQSTDAGRTHAHALAGSEMAAACCGACTKTSTDKPAACCGKCGGKAEATKAAACGGKAEAAKATVPCDKSTVSLAEGTYCAKSNRFLLTGTATCCGKEVAKGSYCEKCKKYVGMPGKAYCAHCKLAYDKSEGCPKCKT